MLKTVGFLNKLKIRQKLLLILVMIGGMLIVMGLTFSYTHVLSKELELIGKHFDNIDTSVHLINENILEARRREKDFLLRHDLKYVTVHKDIITSLNTEFNRLKSLLSDNKKYSVLINDAQNKVKKYNSEFQDVVQLSIINGLDHDSGALGHLRKSVHKIEELVKRQDSLTLSNSMLMMRRHEKDYIARKNDKYIDKINEEYERFLHLLNESEVAEADKINIQNDASEYINGFLTLVKGTKDIKNKIATFRKAVHTTTPTLIKMKELATLQKEKKWDSHKKIIAFMNRLYYGMLFILVALTFPIILIIIRSINQSTQNIINVLDNITEGRADLTSRLDVNNNDEMGEVATRVNTLISNLQQMLTEVDELARHLASTSSKSEKTVEQTRDSINIQASEIKNIVTSMSVLSSAIEQINKNTKTASEFANKSVSSATFGRTIVNEVITSIQQMASNVEKANISLDELSKYSDSINSVVTMINDIAEQTNLLALNAAIEAARAGDAGRGFAVVADEVRALSQRTTASTKQIKSTVQALQQGTKNALEIMNEGRTYAQRSEVQVQLAENSIIEIIESIENIASLSTVMSQSTAEQNTATQLINQNVIQLNLTTNDMAKFAKQSASDSADLSQTAEFLNVISSQFDNSDDKQPEINSKHDVELY